MSETGKIAVRRKLERRTLEKLSVISISTNSFIVELSKINGLICHFYPSIDPSISNEFLQLMVNIVNKIEMLLIVFKCSVMK